VTTSDDRELWDDKGQLCTLCGEHFKYQYLYDEHLPCRAARSVDPTTASIEAQNDDRDQLRAENLRLSRALVAAYTEVEVVKAERDADRRGWEIAERERDAEHGRAELCAQDARAARADRDRLRAWLMRACNELDATGDARAQQWAAAIREETSS